MNKKDFPIFQRKINDKSVSYLDSASTSQKPQDVIDAVVNLYKNSNANIHRGIYTISEEATSLFEGTRKKVKGFINANKVEEIIFTHNTTDALNVAAYGLKKYLQKGDSVLISEMEHHSNILPWQRITKEKGATLLFLRINDEGLLMNEVVDENDKVVFKNISEIPRLKIVALAHMSNVLGTINPLEQMIKDLRLKIKDLIVVIDGAQSVPHMPVDVQKLDCDLLAFSGHKMLGPTGVGVLYGKYNILCDMDPLLIGSHMIDEVSKKGATWAPVPSKFEPGTAAIEAVVGLGTAIDYLEHIGMEKVRAHEKKLTEYALNQLEKIGGVKIYGPKNIENRGGVIAFNIEGVHSHDVAQLLNDDNICVRSGHHCAIPLHVRLQAESSTRASFYIYNDESDVDKLVEGIKKVKKIFKQ